ncbi:hypothetical protein WA026_008252 [Henosepilachna vigintioctopunctata]|uniref:Uncharacterized protein n=1 Tax=Henosepilachna vigintioctopunctata TaxID=420089 RepID=A0AAW1TRC8_9CUCU
MRISPIQSNHYTVLCWYRHSRGWHQAEVFLFSLIGVQGAPRREEKIAGNWYAGHNKPRVEGASTTEREINTRPAESRRRKRLALSIPQTVTNQTMKNNVILSEKTENDS